MTANPFLMDDLNYEMETTPIQQSSNPFLTGMDFVTTESLTNIGNGAGGEGENPFLSSMIFEDTTTTTSTSVAANVPQTISTNPFANFSSSDYSEPVDFFGVVETKTNDFNNIFQQQHEEEEEEEEMAPSNEDDFFVKTELTKNEPEGFSEETADILKVSKPNRPPPPAPMRPPPPRPNPPSKETKDLILSVTGAMEATSSSLLDRLQATRTPSPTPIRDLHSPSPTPDLMGGDTPAFSEESNINLFGEVDVVEVVEESNKDQKQDEQQQQQQQQQQPTVASIVSPPSRPPRPAPPPARPPIPPPSRSVPAPVVAPSNDDDLFDIFSSGTTTTKKTEKVTTSDILGLYNAKAKLNETPQQTSLLDAEPEAFVAVDSTTTTTTTTTTTKNINLNEPIVSESEVITPFGELVNSMAEFPDKNSLQTEIIGNETIIETILDETKLEESIDEANNNQEENLTEPFAKSTSNQSVVEAIKEEQEHINQNEEFQFNESEQPINEISDNSWIVDNEPQIYKNDNPINNIFETEIADYKNENQNQNQIIPQMESIETVPANIFDDVSAAFGNSSEIKTDDFDAFAAKFESAGDQQTSGDIFDPFGTGGDSGGGGGGSSVGPIGESANGAWGTGLDSMGDTTTGFGGDDDSFDAFLSMKAPPSAQATPQHRQRQPSGDSDEDKDFTVFIKPKTDDPNGMGLYNENETVPALAPPPKSPMNAFNDTSRFNPFDKSHQEAATTAITDKEQVTVDEPQQQFQRTDSQETPPTPLFDEDVSQPLEDFPRATIVIDGWEMQLRHPNKKKITGQRFWKKVYVRLISQGDSTVVHLYNTKEDKDPFQELPLQPCYSISDISAQQFDAYGKIFTVKLQYIFYKERPGVRPGQVTKAERITNKLSQFAAYAIQGDYQGCKEFGSDLKKLGLPVEHAPQVSQLLKLGSQNYEDMKQLSVLVEEALFKIPAHRDRALSYKTEEVQITAVDELYVEQNAYGQVEKQIARVRLFFLGFLAGMPDVELGVNDMWRQGKEVVGRHDIIPVITEEWIRLENVEFQSCVQQDEYQNTRVIKFKPPDACYLELFRFRIRPPKNRELPLQVKAVMCVTGNKVELKADVLVPGFSSRKLGQIPCEDIMIRFPIPECWIYLFRVEKHFRYGSVKSTHRRTGKVKGIERFLGAVETLDQSLMEVTSGQAKYEHQHRAIVWRMARLPKEGQGAYTTHTLVCRMNLTSYDQIPEQLAEYCYVEFTMPATQVSHMTVRSVSLQNGAKDDPPEKYVRYLARHEYRVGIEHTQGEGPGAYISATITSKPADIPITEEPAETKESDSDSDSN